MIPHWLAPGFLWGAMWPNIFAPSAITLAAVLVSHVRHQVLLRRSHRSLVIQNERHHSEATAQRLEQHNELKQQAARHHDEALARMDAHALAAKTKARSKP